jgi:hypothetical protein
MLIGRRRGWLITRTAGLSQDCGIGAAITDRFE